MVRWAKLRWSDGDWSGCGACALDVTVTTGWRRDLEAADASVGAVAAVATGCWVGGGWWRRGGWWHGWWRVQRRVGVGDADVVCRWLSQRWQHGPRRVRLKEVTKVTCIGVDDADTWICAGRYDVTHLPKGDRRRWCGRWLPGRRSDRPQVVLAVVYSDGCLASRGGTRGVSTPAADDWPGWGGRSAWSRRGLISATRHVVAVRVDTCWPPPPVTTCARPQPHPPRPLGDRRPRPPARCAWPMAASVVVTSRRFRRDTRARRARRPPEAKRSVSSAGSVTASWSTQPDRAGRHALGGCGVAELSTSRSTEPARLPYNDDASPTKSSSPAATSSSPRSPPPTPPPPSRARLPAAGRHRSPPGSSRTSCTSAPSTTGPSNAPRPRRHLRLRRRHRSPHTADLATADLRDPDLDDQPLSTARTLRELGHVRAVTPPPGPAPHLVTRRSPPKPAPPRPPRRHGQLEPPPAH